MHGKQIFAACMMSRSRWRRAGACPSTTSTNRATTSCVVPKRPPSVPRLILFAICFLGLARLVQTYVLWVRDGTEGLPGELDESGDLDDAEMHL